MNPILKEGSVVGIIAPSDCADESKIETALSFCKKQGYKPVLGNNLFCVNGKNPPLNKRAEDIMNMFLNRKVEAIFCIRGGKDAFKLVDLLDFEIIANNPKPLIGFSDSTSLLNAIYKKAGIMGLHGPFIGRKMSKISEDFLISVLHKGNLVIKPISSWKIVKGGVAKGVLVGGNLEALMQLQNTDYRPDYEGKIMLIEIFGQGLASIKRDLNILKEEGVFDKIRALIFGKVVNSDEPIDETIMLGIVNSIFKKINIPVIFGFDVGHIENQFTLPIGVNLRIDTSTKEIQEVNNEETN